MFEHRYDMPEIWINSVLRPGIEYRIKRYSEDTLGEIADHFLTVFGWVNDGSKVKFNGQEWTSRFISYDSRDNLCEIRLIPNV